MHRRDFIQKAAVATAGLVLSPLRAFAEGVGISPAMQLLSDYMAGAGSRALSDEVKEHAKHHLLDTLASMVSGSELPAGKAAEGYIRAHAGKGTCTIAGTSLLASPADAALANGVMAHADETDDSHNASRSHPGCSVVPAALAMGEEFAIDGGRFLRAVTLGYDIGARVVIAMGDPFSDEGSLSTHSIAGVFGATAAASCACGLDAQQMRWALGYAAHQSSGIRAWRRDTDHIQKAFVFGGMPSRSGVTSALLVRAGWNGVDDLFTGTDNFFQAYSSKPQPEKLAENLGERYEIALTDIKKWTVGSPIQAALDAVAAIHSKRPFEADEVQRVTVRLAPSQARVVDNRDIPDICLQHMIAVMLLDKTVSFHAAHDPPRMKDTFVLRQREKIMLVHDEELAKFLPVRVAIVEIVLSDGTRLSERVTAVRGTPRNPMSRTEVIDKARDLTTPLLGSAKSKRLIDTAYEIESVQNMRSLRSLLQPD